MTNGNNLKTRPRLFTLLSKAILTLAFLLISSTYTHAQALPRIAICQVVEHPALDVNLKGIMEELKSRGYSEESGTEIIIKNAQGNALLMSQISQQLASLEADVYIAIGTQAAQSLMSALKSGQKPLIFSAVTDPKGAKLVLKIRHPEGNVTGVSDAAELKPQFELFQELVPSLRRLGVIYNPGEVNSLASLERMKVAADELNMKIVPVAATKTSEVMSAAKSLIGKVDAYFVDNDNTALASFEGIVKIGLENSLPTFVSDTDMVERGALAALGPNQFDLGRKAGQMAADIIEGTSTSDIAVYFPKKLEKVLNKDISKKLGVPQHSKT